MIADYERQGGAAVNSGIVAVISGIMGRDE